MKNYRIVDSCRTCHFCLEEADEEIYNDLYCREDGTWPKLPPISSDEQTVIQYYKALQRWAIMHSVDKEHICDSYTEAY